MFSDLVHSREVIIRVLEQNYESIVISIILIKKESISSIIKMKLKRKIQVTNITANIKKQYIHFVGFHLGDIVQ